VTNVASKAQRLAVEAQSPVPSDTGPTYNNLAVEAAIQKDRRPTNTI